jgi:hypothetical protein
VGGSCRCSTNQPVYSGLADKGTMTTMVDTHRSSHGADTTRCRPGSCVLYRYWGGRRTRIAVEVERRRRAIRHDDRSMTMTSDWVHRAGLRGGASDAELDEAEHRLGVRLPDDYRSTMRQSDGGDAGFGESWIVLWPVADLAERNEDYQAAECAPGFTYFGSNGANEGYAWDWRQERRSLYAVLPLIGPDPEAAIPCGDTLETFLGTLFHGIAFQHG